MSHVTHVNESCHTHPGDGYIDLHEFIAAFDMSAEAKAKRLKPSLEGLP